MHGRKRRQENIQTNLTSKTQLFFKRPWWSNTFLRHRHWHRHRQQHSYVWLTEKTRWTISLLQCTDAYQPWIFFFFFQHANCHVFSPTHFATLKKSLVTVLCVFTSLICRSVHSLSFLSCIQLFDKVGGEESWLAVEYTAPPAFFDLHTVRNKKMWSCVSDGELLSPPLDVPKLTPW